MRGRASARRSGAARRPPRNSARRRAATAAARVLDVVQAQDVARDFVRRARRAAEEGRARLIVRRPQDHGRVEHHCIMALIQKASPTLAPSISGSRRAMSTKFWNWRDVFREA